MRIQIKVYIEAEKDQDCAGVKPDFWVSAPSIGLAVEELYDLSKPIEEKILGIKEEEDDMSGCGDEER